MHGVYYANQTLRVEFVIVGQKKLEKIKFNYKYMYGVADLLETIDGYKPSDFITINDALERTTEKLGIKMSHSTIARWVAENELGYKLEGKRGQWIVDSLQFSRFIENKDKYVRHYNYQKL